MMDTFQTERLVAERLRADHLGELTAMHNDPRVMATLGGVRTEEQSRRFHEESLDQWDRDGHGLWMLRDRSDGRFVGRGGIRHVTLDGVDEVEIAYALMAEYWGRGLATEMATKFLELAWGHLGMSQLVCFTMTTNLRSRRVMEKVGFRYERDMIHHDLPHVLYRMHSPSRRVPRPPA